MSECKRKNNTELFGSLEQKTSLRTNMFRGEKREGTEVEQTLMYVIERMKVRVEMSACQSMSAQQQERNDFWAFFLSLSDLVRELVDLLSIRLNFTLKTWGIVFTSKTMNYHRVRAIDQSNKRALVILLDLKKKCNWIFDWVELCQYSMSNLHLIVNLVFLVYSSKTCLHTIDRISLLAS